jgi:hypothetical protein
MIMKKQSGGYAQQEEAEQMESHRKASENIDIVFVTD